MRAVLVQQAETGYSSLLPMAEHFSVGALKEAVHGATGVPTTYQILLLDGDKLEDEQTLAEYMLPNLHASARPVFLFDRRSLSRSATPPEEGRPAAPETQQQSLREKGPPWSFASDYFSPASWKLVEGLRRRSPAWKRCSPVTAAERST